MSIFKTNYITKFSETQNVNNYISRKKNYYIWWYLKKTFKIINVRKKVSPMFCTSGKLYTEIVQVLYAVGIIIIIQMKCAN